MSAVISCIKDTWASGSAGRVGVVCGAGATAGFVIGAVAGCVKACCCRSPDEGLLTTACCSDQDLSTLSGCNDFSSCFACGDSGGCDGDGALVCCAAICIGSSAVVGGYAGYVVGHEGGICASNAIDKTKSVAHALCASADGSDTYVNLSGNPKGVVATRPVQQQMEGYGTIPNSGG